MTKIQPRLQRSSNRSWSVPIALSNVPETGRHLDLLADARTRAAIAELAGVPALPRLEASFDVTLHGRHGLHVAGRVSATVGQVCVVTLDAIENEVIEPIDLVFTETAALPLASGAGEEVEIPIDEA